MRQRLAAVLAGAMALVIPLRASDGRKPANHVRSVLAEPARADPATSPWPCQLVIDQNLRPFADSAWDTSATFRHQCRTLAAARATVVVTAASPWEVNR